MGITKLMKNLVKNNTGFSSKNFFLVAVTLVGILLLIVPVVGLFVDIFFNHTFSTDLNGMAAYIAAVAAIFASGGITKAWSEKFEHKNKQQQCNNECNDENDPAAIDQ